MKLREQQLGGRSLYQDASTLRVLLGGMSVPAGGVSSAYYRIWLIHVDGSDPDDYDVNDTGLAAANAAASSGDDILIPPYASFTSNYTITAGVAFIGQSPYATKFTGQITLGAGSYIKDCGINRSGSSTGTNVGVVGPGTGKGYIISCSVTVDQNGAGNAVGLQMGAGEIDSRESYYYGDAASGTGYGITGDGGDCNLSAGCWVRGTTAETDGSDIFGITFDNYIKMLDSGGNLVELYPATDQGLTDALSAASSGDLVLLPVGTISGNHTVGAGITLRGIHATGSILTGTLTTAGGIENLYVNGSASPQVTMTAGTIQRCWITTSSDTAVTQSGGYITGCKLQGRDSTVAAWILTSSSYGWNNNIKGGGVSINVNTNLGLFFCNAGVTHGNATCFTVAQGLSLFGCHARSETGGDGFNFTGAGTLRLVNCSADTNGTDVLNSGAGTLKLYGVEYTSTSGTMTYMTGDRGSYSVEDYHANDIEAAALTRHMPSPGTAGNVAQDDGTNWASVALNESAITLLASASIDTQNGDAKTTVYTVPAGKSAIITSVIIHSPSGSLADGVDFDIGSGANADTWRQTVSLTTMTATTDYMVIPSIAAIPIKYTLEPAAAEFGILPITGATADTTATMDVFGYLI